MTDGNPHVGSLVSDWLTEHGLEEDAHAHAIKRVLAWRIAQDMKDQRIGKNQMAKRMRASRASLDRFPDPANDKARLDDMRRAAAVGRKPRLERA